MENHVTKGTFPNFKKSMFANHYTALKRGRQSTVFQAHIPWKRKGEDGIVSSKNWYPSSERACSCIIRLWFHDGIYKVCSTWRVSFTSDLIPSFGVAVLQKRVIIVMIYIPGVPLMRLELPYWKILRWFRIKAAACPALFFSFPFFSTLPLSIDFVGQPRTNFVTAHIFFCFGKRSKF